MGIFFPKLEEPEQSSLPSQPVEIQPMEIQQRNKQIRKQRNKQIRKQRNKPSFTTKSNNDKMKDKFSKNLKNNLRKNLQSQKTEQTIQEILIIGESNHSLNKKEQQKLKKKYKDAYIFDEGVNEGKNIGRLDDYTSAFRTDILFASLYTKSFQHQYSTSPPIQIKNILLRKKLNVVAGILENEKQPEIVKLRGGWIETKNNKNQATPQLLGSLVPIVNTLHFDFFRIYDYYFGKSDPYYGEMQTLLSLSNIDASLLNILGDQDNVYGEAFKKIVQEARESKMVERVENYMNQNDRRKVVIFTGRKHVSYLETELSKKYSVKTMII
jgi:hypothetical protein